MDECWFSHVFVFLLFCFFNWEVLPKWSLPCHFKIQRKLLYLHAWTNAMLCLLASAKLLWLISSAVPNCCLSFNTKYSSCISYHRDTGLFKTDYQWNHQSIWSYLNCLLVAVVMIPIILYLWITVLIKYC